MARAVHTHRLGSIYVTPETAARLDRIAAQQTRSINELIREALADYIKKHDRRAKTAA